MNFIDYCILCYYLNKFGQRLYWLRKQEKSLIKSQQLSNSATTIKYDVKNHNMYYSKTTYYITKSTKKSKFEKRGWGLLYFFTTILSNYKGSKFVLQYII